FDLSPGSRHLGTVRAVTNFNISDEKTVDALKFSNWEPWSRLFNNNFIRREIIRFDEVKVGNDAGFVLKAGFTSQKVIADKSPIYCVTFRKDSLSFSTSDQAQFEQFKGKILVNNYMVGMNKNYFRPLKNDIFRSRNHGLIRICKMVFLARRYLL